MFHICCSRITIASLHEELSLDLRRAWINAIVVAVMQTVDKVTEAPQMHPVVMMCCMVSEVVVLLTGLRNDARLPAAVLCWRYEVRARCAIHKYGICNY